MKNTRSYKKLYKVLLIFTVVIGVSFVVSRFTNLSFIRDYSDKTDERIQDIKEKITDLEKDDIKETKTLVKLSDQYSQLGTIYLKRQLWDMSIDAFEKCLKYGKKTSGIYYSLGLAYGNRGSETKNQDDIDKAEKYYTNAIDLQDDLYEAKNALAILLFYHKDEKEKALSIVEEVTGRYKKFYIGRFTLGRMYYEMNKLEKSLAAYEELYSDLNKLPPSEIIEDYKKNCRDNIQRIMSEIKRSK